ncbi:nucleotide exchange factor GrpE [Candidatus Nitrosacidococcus sp. I8]|uniref:nucleotide exchange factor GrpE n=1 Tax=Candidatus Nitrosacidococcus sp. I8 TaxID=2942908 RepID=UPI00222635C0|nr:nucleotide exchange factor GrpE [Candidatus Nitrosacidococcus sp. I8]CAH9015948.1 Protein GrpE [Candidatus Nitrosacidococcus sp. I8]
MISEETTSPEKNHNPSKVEENHIEETQNQESLSHISEIEDRLTEALSKADSNWNEVLRAKADLENQRRRYERELEKARKYTLEKFAQDLLPLRDSLEMGLSQAQEENASVDILREGTELILKEFNQITDRFGIKEITPVNEPFNPEFHQAISTQESDDFDPNTVVAVVRKGYLLNDRLLRPAMVVVSKLSRKTPSDEDLET